MAFQYIRLEQEEGVARLTFHRPDKLNALNQDMAREIRAALEEVRRDPQARVLVLFGEGRAFMAGADVTAFLGLDPLAARRFAQRAQELLFFLESLEIPTLAAVHGYALGGGLEIALACDFIYAAQDARLGLPEITLGFIPGVGGTQRLSRLVGPSLAKELIMTGRFLTAEEAQRLGLVARVFPPEKLREETLQAARDLARKPRVALRAAKEAISRGLDMSFAAGCALEAELFGLCFASPDPQEGVRAFLEKRPPRFREDPP